MYGYHKEHFNVLRVIDLAYERLGNTYVVRDLIARYISEAGLTANDIKCEFEGNLPKISLSDGSTILFRGFTKGPTYISILKQTDTQQMWTLINIPPASNIDSFTDPSLPYTPRVDGITIDDEGIFYSSYSPYKKENGKTKYFPETSMLTNYYSNQSLDDNGIEKDFQSIGENLEAMIPDNKYETIIPYSSLNDPTGDYTIFYNLAQAAVKIEETYQHKSRTI